MARPQRSESAKNKKPEMRCITAAGQAQVDQAGYGTPGDFGNVNLPPQPAARKKRDNHSAEATESRPGLTNLGATCYLNVIIQQLYHTAEFRQAVFQVDTPRPESVDPTVFTVAACFMDLRDVFTKMAGGVHNVKPRALHKSVCNMCNLSVEVGRQYDAAEIMRNMLVKYDEYLMLLGLDSAYMFRGSLTYACGRCNGSIKRDLGQIILPVEGMVSIVNSVENFDFQQDSGSDSWCQHPELTLKSCKDVDLPIHIQINLSRSTHHVDAQGSGTRKCCKPVDIPLELSLRHDTDWRTYALTQIVLHKGEDNDGHYVATIKDVTDNTWWLFDDEDTSPVDITKCANMQMRSITPEGATAVTAGSSALRSSEVCMATYSQPSEASPTHDQTSRQCQPGNRALSKEIAAQAGVSVSVIDLTSDEER